MAERRLIRIPLDAKAGRTAEIPTEADRVQIVGPCGVDGCESVVSMEPDWSQRVWLVRHGDGEAAREFREADGFLVTHGYSEWVREVHVYEVGRLEDW